MSEHLVARMREHQTSIFAKMSALSLELGCINLGQGFPDTDGPDELKAIARDAITNGLGNQYPPGHGLPALREAICEHQRRFYALEYDWRTDVVVATGASEAIESALIALLEPGDEAVIFEPWFDIYVAGISMAGAQRVTVPMDLAGGRPNIERMRAAITPRTKLLLINSPHNPTGVVFTREELLEIAALAEEHDLIVISDEAYEHLWFTGHQHTNFATLPGMKERTITVGSAGKTFSFTGWKVGWAVGPADLISAVRSIRQHLSYVSSGPFQYAFAAGLGFPDSYFTEFRASLEHKRDILTNGLAELGFGIQASEGTYFLTTDVRGVGYDSGLTFCEDVPRKAGVVAIPHAALCEPTDVPNPFVRWAFCKKDEVLEQAVDRLSQHFG